MNCLAGCGINKTPEMPIDNEILSPFVTIDFSAESSGTKFTVSVGNNSSPQQDNEVVISSMEYGSSNGLSIEVELIDEQGGNFNRFVDNISKNWQKDKPIISMDFSFGWIGANCSGGISRLESQKLNCNIIEMSSSFSGTKIVYKITGKDAAFIILGTRTTRTIGSSDQKVFLYEAIIRLLSADPVGPNIQVVFYDKGAKVVSPGKFFKDNPKQVWECQNEDRIACVRKWIQDFKTSNDLGIITRWDAAADNPSFAIIEVGANTTDCNGTPATGDNIGTFAVNAGNCSNVISFTPNLNWMTAFIAAAGVGGNAGSATSGQSVDKGKNPDGTDKCTNQPKNAGTTESIPISVAALEHYGPNPVLQSLSDAHDINSAANRAARLYASACDAEIKIVGSPKYVGIDIINKYVSIVVLNPFHIGASGNDCGQWLHNPECNTSLTSKNWLIKGIQHSIRNGSYTTQLKVYLAIPGAEINKLEGMGGDGYKPAGL